MDAKEPLKITLDALHDFKKAVEKQLLIDFVRGNESRDITERGLDKLENYGIGEKYEETYLNRVIDQAIEEKLIKETDDGIMATSKGTAFRKAPKPFILKEDNEDEEPDGSDEALLDSLVENALNNKPEDESEEEIAPAPANTQTARSQQMIHLIQAIDRKIPLDDYAEQMQLGFDEVLDTLETLVHQGVHLDISYFIDEILEKDCQQEMLEFFDSVKGDVEKTIEEFDGVYQPEEIRLMRIIWH